MSTPPRMTALSLLAHGLQGLPALRAEHVHTVRGKNHTWAARGCIKGSAVNEGGDSAVLRLLTVLSIGLEGSRVQGTEVQPSTISLWVT